MKNSFEYIIIGAGPAGLQLAYYFQKHNIPYLVLEKGPAPGTFFKSFPRHGKLISINKIHSGYTDPEIQLRWDWNSLLCDEDDFTFKKYTKEYFPDSKFMVEYLGEFARHFDLNIKFDHDVDKISKGNPELESENFRLSLKNGDSYFCKELIVATGIGKPYVPNIPGIELAENYADVTLDKTEFENKKVLVIGKGNSGFETADYLTDVAALIHVCSPNSIKLAWQTHYVGHLRAVNNNFLDTYQLKSQNALLDADITKITKKGNTYSVSLKYAHASGEEEILEYDRIIICTGFQLDKSIFDIGCEPETMLEDRFPALTAEWESANVGHLYFAGVLMQSNFFKKTTSAFVHGFRYNVKALFHMLAYKHHGMPLRSTPLSDEVGSIATEILNRINKSSALWQQFGYLIDIVEVHDDGTANYFYELPKDYTNGINMDRTFRISLEFGESQTNVFEIDRNPSPNKAQESFFLHPVIRHYEGDELVATCHLVEDLFGEWKHEERHIKQLHQFIEKELKGLQVSSLLS